MDRRPDFSHGLIHLTKETEDTSAFEVLKIILNEEKIKASGRKGFIKGGHKAACLSEIPLAALKDFAQPAGGVEKTRYRPYGILFSKRAIFEAGGRPVIYLPDDEAEWIPEEERWRHVRFEHDKVDWTHEREWRVHGDIDLTDVPGLYVLVWTATEAKEITNLKGAIQKKIRGVLPLEHLMQFL